MPIRNRTGTLVGEWVISIGDTGADSPHTVARGVPALGAQRTEGGGSRFLLVIVCVILQGNSWRVVKKCAS